MKRCCAGMSVRFFFLLVAGILFGCSGSGPTSGEEFLIRVENSILTVSDFEKAFDIAKSAYTHNEMQHPAAFKEAQLRLLNQLTEELIFLERAKELDIRVTDSEVEARISEIKKDYPDGSFEQVLLEQAISFHTWKQRLKIRLLMEKVIEEELKGRVAIKPIDILTYYDANDGIGTDSDNVSDRINEVIVSHLRRQKAEDAYQAWVNGLRNKYTIEINRAQWKQIAKQ